MSAEEYRERLIETLHDAGCDEYIALICLPTKEDFKVLKSALECWNKKGEKQ